MTSSSLSASNGEDSPSLRRSKRIRNNHHPNAESNKQKIASVSSSSSKRRRKKRKIADSPTSSEQVHPIIIKDVPKEEEEVSKMPVKMIRRSTFDGERNLENSSSTLLLDLGPLVKGVLVKRPSASIRSPYVADVKLIGQDEPNSSNNNNCMVLAHAPALDVGGLCSPGSTVWMKDRSKKNGGHTSHSIELVGFSNDDDNNNNNTMTLVGAHPRLGEVLAERVLELGLLESILGFGPVFYHNQKQQKKKKKTTKQLKTPKKTSSKKPPNEDKTEEEETNISQQPQNFPSLQRQCTYGDSRIDFEVTIAKDANIKKLIEVKNVVCADYSALNVPEKRNPNHCVIIAENEKEGNYKRCAIFPWGRVNQTLDGKKVVSARAIKHLRNLVALKNGTISNNNNNNDEEEQQQQQQQQLLSPVVMFVVNRSDCHHIRACHEACPLFAEELKIASESGVQIVSFRVHWTTDGKCYFDGIVPVLL